MQKNKSFFALLLIYFKPPPIYIDIFSLNTGFTVCYCVQNQCLWHCRSIPLLLYSI